MFVYFADRIMLETEKFELKVFGLNSRPHLPCPVLLLAWSWELFVPLVSIWHFQPAKNMGYKHHWAFFFVSWWWGKCLGFISVVLNMRSSSLLSWFEICDCFLRFLAGGHLWLSQAGSISRLKLFMLGMYLYFEERKGLMYISAFSIFSWYTPSCLPASRRSNDTRYLPANGYQHDGTRHSPWHTPRR